MRRAVAVWVAAVVLAAVAAAPASAGEAKVKPPKLETWRFGSTSLAYPAGWEKLNQQDAGTTRILTLRRKTPAGPVLVAVAVSPGPPPPDDNFRQRPGLAAFGFGYPLAKKTARNAKGEGATASFGMMELARGPAASARIVMPVPAEAGKLVMVDAGVQHLGDVMIAAAVITTGKRGDLNDDVALHATIAEAYGILRSFGKPLRAPGP